MTRHLWHATRDVLSLRKKAGTEVARKADLLGGGGSEKGSRAEDKGSVSAYTALPDALLVDSGEGRV